MELALQGPGRAPRKDRTWTEASQAKSRFAAAAQRRCSCEAERDAGETTRATLSVPAIRRAGVHGWSAEDGSVNQDSRRLQANKQSLCHRAKSHVSAACRSPCSIWAATSHSLWSLDARAWGLLLLTYCAVWTVQTDSVRFTFLVPFPLKNYMHLKNAAVPEICRT
jgi:hypothetical protein